MKPRTEAALAEQDHPPLRLRRVQVDRPLGDVVHIDFGNTSVIGSRADSFDGIPEEHHLRIGLRFVRQRKPDTTSKFTVFGDPIPSRDDDPASFTTAMNLQNLLPDAPAILGLEDVRRADLGDTVASKNGLVISVIR